jgi:hypothetical protein
LQPSSRDHPKHPLWSPGFGDEHTNVIVPLSSRLALMGLPYEFTARARVRYDRREVADQQILFERIGWCPLCTRRFRAARSIRTKPRHEHHHKKVFPDWASGHVDAVE